MNYTIVNSAVAGYDYVNGTQTLYFGSQDSTMCVNIFVNDDNFIEANETFMLSLSVSADVNYTFIGPMGVTVIIMDDDGTLPW